MFNPLIEQRKGIPSRPKGIPLRHAIVGADLIVRNVCKWDGRPWTPPANTYVVALGDDQECGTNWMYDPVNNKFFRPEILQKPEPEELEEEPKWEGTD